MNDDQPPRMEASGLPQVRMVAGGGGVMFGDNACFCEGEEVRLPLSLAHAALQKTFTSPEGVLEFRKALTGIACEHDWVSLTGLRAELYRFAFQRIWGPRRETLAEAVAEKLAREQGFPPGLEPVDLLEVCIRFVDQAAGRLEQRAVAYDPTRGRDLTRPPSLASFVTYRARRELARVFAKGQGNPEPDAPEPPEWQTERHAESEILIGVVHRAVRDAVGYLSPALRAEEKLLDLLEAALAGAEITPFLRKNLVKTTKILRRAINNHPGHCIVLDCGIGAASDAPQLILGTNVTTPIALALYQSPNATILNAQAARWCGRLLELVAEDPIRAVDARRFAQFSLTSRRAAFEILKAITETISRIAPGNVERRTERWLGPPQRDLTDAARGVEHTIGGVGIAHIPFLFGLRDMSGGGPFELGRLPSDNDHH